MHAENMSISFVFGSCS